MVYSMDHFESSVRIILSTLEWHLGFEKVSIGELLEKWKYLTGTEFPGQKDGFHMVIEVLSKVEGIVIYDHFYVKLTDHRLAVGKLIKFPKIEPNR